MSRPRLKSDLNVVPGLAALGLFAVMAVVFLQAQFTEAAGFAADANITASIGYAMFDMTDLASVSSESFLVAFEIIDLVLVAALAGAVLLARREEGGNIVTAITDGGQDLKESVFGEDGGDR